MHLVVQQRTCVPLLLSRSACPCTVLVNHHDLWAMGPGGKIAVCASSLPAWLPSLFGELMSTLFKDVTNIRAELCFSSNRFVAKSADNLDKQFGHILGPLEPSQKENGALHLCRSNNVSHIEAIQLIGLQKM